MRSLINESVNLIRQDFSVSFSYGVYFTNKLFNTDNQLFSDLLKEGQNRRVNRVVFIIDSAVAKYHSNLADKIVKYCNHFPEIIEICGHPLVIEGGELAKNDIGLIKRIIQFIDDHSIDRHAYVVGIGGGAILDLVGFVAAIAHRGIRHIRIPTTVLSQNDAGVGVKNGINYLNKKNYLGTFVPPFAVINDSNFLHTLEDRDWRSGISEALKVALIRDFEFFNWIDDNVGNLVNRDLATMETLIYRCAKHHLLHIGTNGDPFEKGSSRPLDFGHWAAHKLEQLTHYQLRHGEAVAIGIALDVAYSHYIGLLDEKSMDRVHSCLLKLGFDIYHPLLSNSLGDHINPSLLDGLEEFREHLGGILTIMLIKQLGNGIEVNSMNQVSLDAAINNLRSKSI